MECYDIDLYLKSMVRIYIIYKAVKTYWHIHYQGLPSTAIKIIHTITLTKKGTVS